MNNVSVPSFSSLSSVVRTEGGRIEGVSGDDLVVFKGVPYAAPPVGPLRWRPPEPAQRWNGIRPAREFGPTCPQMWESYRNHYFTNVKEMSEDCLYLNIWAPEKQIKGKKYPVIVWIYGGGFISGTTSSPQYDGSRFARKGVVFVSIAYRTGPFGFLAHPQLTKQSDNKTSGNYGLLDQIAALKWIQKNIKVFGGDPGKVTLMGESAGAISISILAASPKARGLFSRVISQSGGSMQPPRWWSSLNPNEGGLSMPTLGVAEAYGRAFLARLHVKSLSSAYALDAKELVAATGPVMGTFWPPLDGGVVAGEPYGLYQAGLYNDIPCLIGTNSDEGAIFMPDTGVELYKMSVEAQYGQFARDVLDAYPAKDREGALRAARDLVGDVIFRWPTWAWGRLQAQTGRSPVFSYIFTRKTTGTPLLGKVGAIHASEIPFAFNNPQAGWNKKDQILSDTMLSYWVNFASNGDPNADGLPEWRQTSAEGAELMKLSTNKCEMVKEPSLRRLNMLDRYFAWRRSEFCLPKNLRPITPKIY